MTQEQINNFNLIISKFNELGILEHVEFIGSWATYLYQQYFRDDRFIPDLRTRDIDILYPNIRKPRHAVVTNGKLCQLYTMLSQRSKRIVLMSLLTDCLQRNY